MGRSIVFGRGPRGTVPGPGCVNVDSPWVSMSHARVHQLDDGTFSIEDLHSGGGTWILPPIGRAIRVPAFPGGPIPVPRGSRIILGTVIVPWVVDR